MEVIATVYMLVTGHLILYQISQVAIGFCYVGLWINLLLPSFTKVSPTFITFEKIIALK